MCHAQTKSILVFLFIFSLPLNLYYCSSLCNHFMLWVLVVAWLFLPFLWNERRNICIYGVFFFSINLLSDCDQQFTFFFHTCRDMRLLKFTFPLHLLLCVICFIFIIWIDLDEMKKRIFTSASYVRKSQFLCVVLCCTNHD